MSARALRSAAIGLGLVFLAGAPGNGQAPGTKVTPKLEAVAETKLLMEGLAHANFRGMERLLTDKPADAQTWTFARGQALLVAETANLLMLRPPKNQGQPVWFERAADLRKQATQLAMTLAQRDYPGSRAGLQQLAASCNRCHQTFRVEVEIVPFAQPPPPKVE
jgi:cytochrome c556